jgi:RNA polymerase sigma-70 factor (ECF subfamily)
MSPPLTKALDTDAALAAEGALAPREKPAIDESFPQLFEQHAPLVWRALRHLGVREADVADQCQEVFLVIYRRYDSFEGRSTLDTWIYGICLRIASEYRRRAYVRREVVQGDVDLGVVQESQTSDVERTRWRSRLLQLLDALDEAQRDTFVLYEIEGLSMKKIAEIMQCPLQTAYSRLRLARTAILEAYNAAAPGER